MTELSNGKDESLRQITRTSLISNRTDVCPLEITDVSLSLWGQRDAQDTFNDPFCHSFCGQFRKAAGVKLMAAKGGDHLPF